MNNILDSRVQAKIKGIKLVIFDFDGVFTDNCVYVSDDGRETVRCWRSDGLGLSRIKEIGLKIAIVSTESNGVVSKRAKKLKLRCSQGVKNKAEEVLSLCNGLGVNPINTMFVGNDINDIPAFRIVGLPVGVADSHPAIHRYIEFITNKPGGAGAVREICDLIMESQDQNNFNER